MACISRPASGSFRKIRTIMGTQLVLTCAAVFSAALLSSCSSTGNLSGLAAYQAYDLPAGKPADPGHVRVKVSLRTQRAYVVEGSEILLAMPVSIGAPGSPTPEGKFAISRKAATERSGREGYAYRGESVKKTSLANKPRGWNFKGTPLPYWCQFKPGYGFHTGWLRHHPCTDGCIRMHENLAPKFFDLVKVGTPVDIAYSQPEDARVPTLPLPPDAGPLPDYPDSMYLGDGYFTRHKAPVNR